MGLLLLHGKILVAILKHMAQNYRRRPKLIVTITLATLLFDSLVALLLWPPPGCAPPIIIITTMISVVVVIIGLENISDVT